MRMLSCFQAALVIAAYALLGLCRMIASPRGDVPGWIILAILVFAAIGFISGVGLLLVLRGVSKTTVLLGFTTIAAFVLLLLSCGSIW
jgi:hypothetical protein